MNSSHAKRFLARNGCTFEPGKGGHLLSVAASLWRKILKDLDIKER